MKLNMGRVALPALTAPKGVMRLWLGTDNLNPAMNSWTGERKSSKLR